MGDEHHGLVLGHLRELFIESVLAKGIHCRRGLVENENLRVTHEGAGNREVLPLASGEIDALVEGLAENRFVAVGQPADDVMGAGLLGGGLHERSLVNGVDLSQADVIRSGHVVAEEVLVDDADVATIVLQVVVPQIPTVQQDATLARVVQPGQQFDERGLASTVFADYRGLLSSGNRKRDPFKDSGIRRRVLERDIAKLDSPL